METNIKITRLYSNDSKKARLKRRKNKFQRVWDPEKQTYVKVKKVRIKKHFSKEEMKARFGTKTESAPVAKKEVKTAEKKVIHAKDAGWKKPDGAVTIRMNGEILAWDGKVKGYRKVA